MPDSPNNTSIVGAWRTAASNPETAAELEAIYQMIADQVEARGPACWASGRCCKFEKTGHRLYVTGLEAAYTITKLGRALGAEEIVAAHQRGDCPFLTLNLCSVHTIKPVGCRVYFCDKSAQDWQRELSERALDQVRRLHDRHGIPYRYGEWRAMLDLFTS
jgi:Fe-S-cluster containining protein